MITVTDNAKQKILSILENEDRKGHGLHVTASRGMSPLSVEYGLSFVEPGQEDPEDKIVEFEGFRIYVDTQSVPLLDGAVVDYVAGLNESGFKITNAKAADQPDLKGPLAEKIKQVLETKVNPGIRSHGGIVSLVDVKDDIAYLQFGGGCQGCGMVDVTLRQGVEQRMREVFPDMVALIDKTDHADGNNPYFQPGK